MRDSSRMGENVPRRLRGRNSHYGMDGRVQEVEIRKRVNWAIPGGTPPGAYARRAWLVNIHIFIPFLLLISSCPVIERNSLMRYKRKRPAARRSSITAARRGADRLKSTLRSLARSFARLTSHAAADKPILAGHVYTRACDRIRNPRRPPCRTPEPDLRTSARRVPLRKNRATVSRMTKARRGQHRFASRIITTLRSVR